MTTSTTPDADYAFWTIPGTAFTVTYSLATFHEIEFVVNEGYRRIPHGGIETGGLLFGRIEAGGVRVESFRPIECEHASGPSLNLSPKDVAGLEAQISSAAGDPELSGLAVVGWFAAHTRSPLKMTEREAQLFNQLFPGPGKITVLVKPERFHPTRFGFLFRDKEGRLLTDATTAAIILPGRGIQGTEGPVPSIVAPIDPPATGAPERPASDSLSKPAASKGETRPKTEPQPEIRVSPDSSGYSSRSVPLNVPSLALEHVPDTPSLPMPAAQFPEVWNAPGAQLPPARLRPRLDDERKSYGAQFALVLLIAAVLGCCVGYWAYLQLPSAIIPLTVRAQQEKLLVSWPPVQTSTSAFAAIRVDDGEPLALSSTEKQAGQTSVASGADDVKIELIAQHWLRNSRGIVRFIRAGQPRSSSPPAALNLNQSLPALPGSQQLP